MRLRLIIFVAAHLATLGLASSQEKDPWIGKRVFTQFGTVLKVGNEVVDDKGRSRSLAVTGHDRADAIVYRVEHVNGEWLWLKDEKSSKAGWVQMKWVIPYEKAIEFYTIQIRANPQAAYYGQRGNIWCEKGENGIAIADYSEAIRLEPGEALYWANRGNSLRCEKKYDKSIIDLNEAIRLDKRFAYAYCCRGNTWDSKKEYDKAIADYNEAIQLDPKYVGAYLSRASTLRDKKDYEKSIASLDIAIGLDSRNADCYNQRGFTWESKKEYSKAISDYNESIRIDPMQPYAYCERASIWATCSNEKFRDGRKAVESASKACELSQWKETNSLETLAAAYAESGDFEKAVEWQEKANNFYDDAEDKKKGEERLNLYRDKKPYHRDEN